MYPLHLVTWFWDEVRRLLVEQHALSQAQAEQGVSEMRQWWKSHAGDDEGVIYNGGPERAAHSIAKAIRNGGWSEPESTAPGESQTRGIA